MTAMAGPVQMLFGLLTALCGIVVFGYYASKKCDPLRAGYITNPNQVCRPIYFMMLY